MDGGAIARNRASTVAQGRYTTLWGCGATPRSFSNESFDGGNSERELRNPQMPLGACVVSGPSSVNGLGGLRAALAYPYVAWAAY